MASAQDNKILFKRSLIGGATPTGLTTGEIAVNIADELIFVGATNGNYITFNSVGPTGPQGFQGFQGTQGTTGPQGFQGTQGTQGRQGPQGFQGFQGTQGTTGPQGFQGFQGFQGTQGTQGPTGIVGTINSETGIQTLNIVGGSNITVTNTAIGSTLGITIDQDGPTNSYGLTSYDNGKGVQVYDKLSLIYGKANSSGAVSPGGTANFSSIDEYYYSQDIQYDSWNKITTLLRFNEKIHINGGITGPTSATSGGPWDIDVNNGTLQMINLSNAATGTAKYFSFIPNISDSTFYPSSISFILMVVGGNELTVNWPTGMKWETDLGAPSLGTSAQMTIIPFTYLMGSSMPSGTTGWIGGADLKYSIAT